jgi:hypothetical protein
MKEQLGILDHPAVKGESVPYPPRVRGYHSPSRLMFAQLEAGAGGFVSVVHVPGNPLASCDISWVEPTAWTDELADRSNAASDVIRLVPIVFGRWWERFTGLHPVQSSRRAIRSRGTEL